MAIKIQDANDNKPKFSQLKYETFVPTIYNRNFAQEVLKYEVKDNDLGVYGELGLKCFLLGDESDKFEIDEKNQKVLLKACPKCSRADLKPIYKFELICKDQMGKNFSLSTQVFQKNLKHNLLILLNN